MHPIMVAARTLTLAFTVLLSTVLTAEAVAPSSRTDTVLAAAPKATWIAEGEGRRVVYVFFDPNCPSCQLLYRNLRSFIGSHDLQLRWIPVAVVNVTSLGKAAAILEAPDPPAALRRNEEQYDAQAYAGGIPEDIPSTKTERKVHANEQLLTGLDIPVVPSMLFAAKDGRAVLIQGALSPLALRKVFARLP